MGITESIYTVLADIAGLSLFANVRESPVLGSLRDLLEDAVGDREEAPVFEEEAGSLDIVQDWAAFTGAFILCQRDYSFFLTVAWLALTDDNPYTQAAESQEPISPVLAAVAKADLARLGRIASFDIRSLGFYIADLLRKTGLEQMALSVEEESRVFWAASHPGQGAGNSGGPRLSYDGNLLQRIFPENGAWAQAIPAIGDYLRTFGAGILGQFDAFYWTPPQPLQAPPPGPLAAWFSSPPPGFLAVSLHPVKNPDTTGLGDLFGYEEQRSVVIANTLHFLEGRPANNLLLYGDRGTGKSATVKAVCREFAHRGLKLLQIDKGDLAGLPGILELLAVRAQFFVIFIDDLSFETADDSFRTLKALLEGGIESRPPNVLIYATSNRRHLVKENRVDRPSTGEAANAASTGDVRAFDSMQEQLSLSDRFGLTVVFTAPSQEEYLRIAECIAEKRGILEKAESENRRLFRENALRWERWFNGRSPRTAVQYVDWLDGSDPGGGSLGGGSPGGSSPGGSSLGGSSLGGSSLGGSSRLAESDSGRGGAKFPWD